MILSRRDVANRLAALYEGRALQGYVRWKVRTDPVYGAVLDELKALEGPVVDVGCGVGLLPFYLREHGCQLPILGVDFDERKIDAARRAATRYSAIDFVNADARNPLPDGHHVVILDILQYFGQEDQRAILSRARAAVPPGGVVLVRQGLKDDSWRHRLTAGVDRFAGAIRWMRGRNLNFPTRNDILAPFEGLQAEVRPLWGRTPYNNYLFVFRSAAEVAPMNEGDSAGAELLASRNHE